MIVTSATFVVAMGVMYALHQASLLRVSPEAEIAGLDLYEHGAAAYPEYLTAPETVPLTLVPHGGNNERTPVTVIKPAAFAPAMGEGVR